MRAETEDFYIDKTDSINDEIEIELKLDEKI